MCANSKGLSEQPEPSLVAYVISTIIPWAGSNIWEFTGRTSCAGPEAWTKKKLTLSWMILSHVNNPMYFRPPHTSLLYSKRGVCRGIHYFATSRISFCFVHFFCLEWCGLLLHFQCKTIIQAATQTPFLPIMLFYTVEGSTQKSAHFCMGVLTWCVYTDKQFCMKEWRTITVCNLARRVVNTRIIRTPQNFAVTTLKFEQDDFTKE